MCKDSQKSYCFYQPSPKELLVKSISKCYVRLPHLWNGDIQGQEKFLAPSAYKQICNYDTECLNHHPSLWTLRPKGLSHIYTLAVLNYILWIRMFLGFINTNIRNNHKLLSLQPSFTILPTSPFFAKNVPSPIFWKINRTPVTVPFVKRDWSSYH